MTLATRVRRAWNAFKQPPKPVIHEKQFVFMWRDTESRQVQWHLVDYETYAKEGYNTNALAHMAIKYKTDSLALVQLRGYMGDVDNPDILPPDNELAILLDRPNSYQSQYEFMQLADTYYNIDGNAFIYMRRDNGVDNLPTSLHVLRPDRVFIKPIQIRGLGDILFLYTPEGTSYQEGIPILQRDMMHIKTPNPYDPLEGMGYGLPGLMPVSRDVDMDNMITQFLFNIFDHQGIMPGGYIETPYEMDEDDIATLRQQFQDSEGGYQNWGRPIVLDQSQVYKPSALTLDQLNVEAIDKRQIKRILGVFGVPGKLIGLDDDSSTFSNVAEAREEFWTRTMLAELKAFEDEFKYRLRVEGQDWFCSFDTTDVPALQQDLSDASAIYATLVEHGVPPNEAARRVDLKIAMIEGGDTPLILGSLIPLKQALEPPAPAPNPFQQAPNGGDNEDDTGDNDMEDVPVEDDEDDEKRVKASRWDFDTKQSIWKALDSVTESWESRFRDAAETAFLSDLEAIRAIIKNSKASKAVIEWAVARRGINLYLSTTGAQMWRTTFAPVIIGLTEAQTERWIQRAPDMFPPGTFSLRNVQAEAWFNNHLLTFATAINDTTRNDIHRLLSDGLEHGLSNDRMADAIEQLFVQYMQGDVDPQTFAFLQDRMPAYRREMIARTETHGAMSTGNHALYQSAGVQRKEWLATRDGRTRDTHLQAWNKYSEGGTPGPIPIDMDFMVGGFNMRYPGDRSAPIGEWVQCRCVEIPFME